MLSQQSLLAGAGAGVATGHRPLLSLAEGTVVDVAGIEVLFREWPAPASRTWMTSWGRRMPGDMGNAMRLLMTALSDGHCELLRVVDVNITTDHLHDRDVAWCSSECC